MTDSVLQRTDEAVAQLINGIYENTPQTAEYIITTLSEGEVIMGYFWVVGFLISILALVAGIVMLCKAWKDYNGNDSSGFPTAIIAIIFIFGIMTIGFGNGIKKIFAPEAVVLEKLMEKM